MKYLNEPDLYRLIMASKLPDAVKDHRGNNILRDNSPENGLVGAKPHKSSRTGAGAGAGAEAGSAQVIVDPIKTIKEETIKRERWGRRRLFSDS